MSARRYPRNDPSAPYSTGAAVTPSDVTTFDPTDVLFVGGAGNLVLTMEDGTALTLTGVPAGFHKIACTQVKAATTATNIACLYCAY